MRHRPRTPTVLLALLAALALPACDMGDDDSRVSFPRDGAAVDEDDVYAIHSRENEVRLGLTEEQVYLRLSDEKLAEIEADMADDVDDESGLGAVISDAVTAGVSRALRFRVAWDVHEIEEIRYEDGRIVIEKTDGEIADVEMTVDDEDITNAFAEEDVRQFIREFERVKAR